MALLELLDRSHREARDELIITCTERFERRLAEEGANLRVHSVQLGAELRQEMAAMRADLRQEIATMGAELRQEMAMMGAELRQEMATMGADLRQEMATGRVDLFKWCFLFWIGQVLAVGGMMGVMLRLVR